MAWAGAVGSGVAAAARLIDAGIDKATAAGPETQWRVLAGNRSQQQRTMHDRLSRQHETLPGADAIVATRRGDWRRQGCAGSHAPAATRCAPPDGTFRYCSG